MLKELIGCHDTQWEDREAIEPFPLDREAPLTFPRLIKQEDPIWIRVSEIIDEKGYTDHQKKVALMAIIHDERIRVWKEVRGEE